MKIVAILQDTGRGCNAESTHSMGAPGVLLCGAASLSLAKGSSRPPAACGERATGGEVKEQNYNSSDARDPALADRLGAQPRRSAPRATRTLVSPLDTLDSHICNAFVSGFDDWLQNTALILDQPGKDA